MTAREHLLAEPRSDTRQRLLTAAAALFAEQGFATTSVRQIISAAGVANGAAVGYHFGSKERLLSAVIEEAVGPTLFEYERALAALEALAAPPSAREIGEALVRPLVRLRRSARGALASRLVVQHLAEPASIGLGELPARLARLSSRCEALFVAAAPPGSRAAVPWRLRAMTGSMVAYLVGFAVPPDEAEEAAVDALGALVTDALQI